jgi:spermidine/putrescine transport system permease protein
MVGKITGLLSVVLTYIFLYVPLVVLAIFSFNAAIFPSPWTGFTWKWYRELYYSTYLWDAFYNSLVIAFIAMSLSLLMAITLIFYAAQKGRVNKIISLFYVNLFVPEIVLAVGLLALFKFLNVSLGLISLIVAHTTLGIGYAVPLIYSRFLELDYRLTEASLDLGASYGQTFRRIILPLLMPSIIAAGLLIFVLSFDDFVLSYFCAGSSTQTLSLYILSMLRSGISPVVNALSTLLLLLSSILVLLFCSLHKRSRIF